MRSSATCSARDISSGFRLSPRACADATPQERLIVHGRLIEWVLAMQQEEAARETSEEGKTGAPALWRCGAGPVEGFCAGRRER